MTPALVLVAELAAIAALVLAPMWAAERYLRHHPDTTDPDWFSDDRP